MTPTGARARSVLALFLLLLLPSCGGSVEGPDAAAPQDDRRTATLASLRLGHLTGGGDYVLSGHFSRRSTLAVNDELLIAPGGVITGLTLRIDIREGERRGAGRSGFEVIRPDADKVLLRFSPPGPVEARSFQVDPMGAREILVRPLESRALVIIRGGSWVEWIPESRDSTSVSRRR